MKNIIDLIAVCALMIATALSGYYGGKHETAKPVQFDYYINITDSGTQIYTMQGKFVDFVPFDSTSAFDNAMMADNL